MACSRSLTDVPPPSLSSGGAFGLAAMADEWQEELAGLSTGYLFLTPTLSSSSELQLLSSSPIFRFTPLLSFPGFFTGLVSTLLICGCS